MQLGMKVSHENDIQIQDETERRAQVFLRTLPIFLIPVAATIVVLIIVAFIGPAVPASAPVGPSPGRGGLIPLVVIAVFFIALVALVRFGRPNLSSVLLIGVWTLLTTVFGLMNGVSSIWAALLIVPICAAGLLIDGVASMTLAALATLLMIGLGLLEWQGIVAPRTTIPPFLEAVTPIISTGFWIGIFWTIAALTYILSNSLQRALNATRAQARELRELSDSLEARVQQQTAALLEQSRETAVMEERARVARDIHDTLAQGLTGIVVQLGAAQRALQATPNGEGTNEASGAALKHMALAQSMAREALAEARRSIWNLRAGNLERGELRDALAGLATRNSNAQTHVTFATRGEPWPLHADVESALVRVTQEALVNVGKHANATAATVTLVYMPDAVRLVIHDNGVGWDDALNAGAVATGPYDGFGLMGMRERIQQWGGTLTLSNEGGAKVEAVLPRARVEHGAAASSPQRAASGPGVNGHDTTGSR